MLIQGLLVGAIGGIFAYTCKIVYEANKSDDKVIEVENIVKYEYIPVGEWEDIEMEYRRFNNKIIARIYSPLAKHLLDGSYHCLSTF